MKLGLVLEGGAMRGMYTAGVLDVFMEEGIAVDGIVGVSAGALFGVNLLSGQKGRVIRYNKRFNSDRNYLGLRPLLREGNIVSTQYAYEEVPHKLDPFDAQRYRDSGVPFYAVVTDVASGKPEYIQVKDVFEQMDVLRASGSMPYVSKPVDIDGRHYLDGGISDSIPYRWMADQGYDKLIVVLTRDAAYRKHATPRALTGLYRRKFPAIADVLRRRHECYNTAAEEIRTWEEDGRAFVIRPSKPITIATIEKDPQKLQAVYDLGVHDAKASLAALRGYMENK